MKYYLKEILAEVSGIDPEIKIRGIKDDSREVTANDLFLAYKGEKVDRKNFISEVKAKGGIVVSDEAGVGDYYLPNLKEKIGILAERFFEYPSRKLKIIGVTGTNGKSTVAYLTYQMLNLLKVKTLFIGTLGIFYEDKHYITANTTLGALALTEWLAKGVEMGIQAVVMEVSAHALTQFRVDHLTFDSVIFTNLTRDHLDYYTTLEKYRLAKARLFFELPSCRKIINYDDAWGKELVCELPQAISYSINDSNANLWCGDKKFSLSGTECELNTPWGTGKLSTSLVGDFNLSNCLAVIGSLGGLYDFKEIMRNFKKLKAPTGRLEIIQKNDSPWVVVDYAHTPDALAKVLALMGNLKFHKLTVIFGCGGERDEGKRPVMGEIAVKLADWVIITNDNTRREDPEKIAASIIKGISPNFQNWEKILDRRTAIQTGIQRSSKGDVVLIVGRGHEDCLEIGKERHYFTDQAEAKKWLF